MGFVYFIYDKSNIKIGFTKNIKKRIKELQTSNSNKLVLLGYFIGDMNKEQELHNQFKNYQILNEWFRPDQKLIDYINENNIMDVYLGWIKDKLFIYNMIRG